MATIDEKTKIPLFAALSGLVVIIGGIIWLTTIANTSNANAATIETLETRMHGLTIDTAEMKGMIKEIRDILRGRR